VIGLTGSMGRAARVRGFDDVGVVDRLKVDRRMARLCGPSWRWTTSSGSAFVGHLDGVRPAGLMRRDAPPHAGGRGGPPQIRPDGGA
jgi:hypothetical protein